MVKINNNTTVKQQQQQQQQQLQQQQQQLAMYKHSWNIIHNKTVRVRTYLQERVQAEGLVQQAISN